MGVETSPHCAFCLSPGARRFPVRLGGGCALQDLSGLAVDHVAIDDGESWWLGCRLDRLGG